MGGQLQNTFNPINVVSALRDYRVVINSQIQSYVFTDNSILISDERFSNLFDDLQINKIYLQAYENKKSLEVCVQVLTQLQEYGANKSTKLIAVGGGIIQDITTLVASLYMRGLEWVYFPTTSMSQLDSCIGGKSSINLHGKKNIVGNIYPPCEIHLDTSFYSSLSASAIVSGYLEAIKISFAYGKEGFGRHIELSNEYVDLSAVPLAEITELVLNQKRHFVETDEFDRGIRQYLNFGHTFGHALESASAYKIPHGIAIGLGMLMANLHPLASKRAEIDVLNRTIRNLLSQIDLNLHELLSPIQEEDFLQFFLSDKKHGTGNYTVVIAGDNGLAKITKAWDFENRELILKLLHKIKVSATYEVQ
jgi:3-dehydroquinate synthase